MSADADNLYDVGEIHHISIGRWPHVTDDDFAAAEFHGKHNQKSHGRRGGSGRISGGGNGPDVEDTVVARSEVAHASKDAYHREISHNGAGIVGQVYDNIVADPERGAAMAAEYQALPEYDASPETIKGYTALRTELKAQYEHMTKSVKVEVVDHDPYKNVGEMIADIESNGTLKVLATDQTGGHPFLTNAENDMFRAVHDFYGHAAIGRDFSRHGEEAAFRSHAEMFKDHGAQRALATETRGQNSMVNYGPNPGEFPVQKFALMPSQYATTGMISREQPTVSSKVYRQRRGMTSSLVSEVDEEELACHSKACIPPKGGSSPRSTAGLQTAQAGGRKDRPARKKTRKKRGIQRIHGKNPTKMKSSVRNRLYRKGVAESLIAEFDEEFHGRHNQKSHGRRGGGISKGPEQGTVSSRVPTSTKVTSEIEGQTTRLDEIPDEHVAKMAAAIADNVPGFQGMSTDQVMKQLERNIDREMTNAVKNSQLDHIDGTPEDWKTWYEAANGSAKEIAANLGVSDAQGAALLAVLSPQNPWDMNVANAEAVAKVMGANGGKGADITAGVAAAVNAELGTNIKPGGTLSDLNNREAAVAVRALAGEGYPTAAILPRGGKMVKVPGEGNKMTWKSYNSIEKAVSVLRDGSPENLHKQLGKAHKVRSFYNNIIDPKSPQGDVTVDTHHFGIAFGIPVGTSHRLISSKAGSATLPNKPSHAATGSQGVYPLVAEATRRVAAKHGLQPREVQSITWESWRHSYPSSRRATKSGKPGAISRVESVWKDYYNGEIKQKRTVYRRIEAIRVDMVQSGAP